MTINASTTQWQHLEPSNSSWRKQFRFKGKRLLPFTVYSAMQTESMTLNEAADNWDLSPEQVAEAIDYCKANLDLIEQDANDEYQYLENQGVQLESKTAH